MQLILVSGLSGSGKSIALNVLEDAGYYCVDNLPATLLLEVRGFLADAGHDKAAISVDARSAALRRASRARRRAESPRRRLPRALPRGRHADACCGASPRRAAVIRSPAADLSLAEAIEHERTLLAGVAALGHRIDTSELQPRVLQNWIRDLLGIGAMTLTLLFESFAYRDGIPLDADWVLDARMLPNPHYDPQLRALHRARATR